METDNDVCATVNLTNHDREMTQCSLNAVTMAASVIRYDDDVVKVMLR